MTLVLVLVSAYLRLDHSGVGCADWPSCYGRIGSAAAEPPTLAGTYERLAGEAQSPGNWATRAHRLVASLLGVLVLSLTLVSVWQRRNRLLTLFLLGLTVFLSWLGIYSGGLHSPAVVMGNLCGGFAMLALLGWLVFRSLPPAPNASPATFFWAAAALLMLTLQIGLGGLTSANFAASACQTVPDCHGSYLPGPGIARALDLSRRHEIGPTGLALGGAERADIHKLHRLGAVATMLVSVVAVLFALHARAGITAIVALLLVTAECVVGLAAILTRLPIEIAVAHNWLAAFLLLALLRLLALSRNREAYF